MGPKKTFGSRAEVFHGTAKKTSGGLIKKDFYFNIADDIEFLYESDFFHDNKDTLFNIDNMDKLDYAFTDTRRKREKIIINPKCKGSPPNAIATGINTGTKINIADILSINIPIKISNKLTLIKNKSLLSEKPNMNSEIF